MSLLRLHGALEILNLWHAFKFAPFLRYLLFPVVIVGAWLVRVCCCVLALIVLAVAAGTDDDNVVTCLFIIAQFAVSFIKGFQ